jgi:hypothetical protein
MDEVLPSQDWRFTIFGIQFLLKPFNWIFWFALLGSWNQLTESGFFAPIVLLLFSFVMQRLSTQERHILFSVFLTSFCTWMILFLILWNCIFLII